MINRFFPASLVLLVLAGCANDPVPTEQLRLTEQAIEQASAVGATAEDASMQLALSKQQLAKAALLDEQYKEARVLAEQAELDAREAESRVLASKSTEQLLEINKRINRMRKQLGYQL
ncbi:DUF4398 domain-containing protein [Pseudomonas sp. NPDC078700]|uniref:DUF4398 domain-containing protein n=1 Tax=Pseudomonas sp. NPDC078700 TaxID=3364424 RepID=UPI0037CA3995